jgi:hypothetical protein
MLLQRHRYSSSVNKYILIFIVCNLLIWGPAFALAQRSLFGIEILSGMAHVAISIRKRNATATRDARKT